MCVVRLWAEQYLKSNYKYKSFHHLIQTMETLFLSSYFTDFFTQTIIMDSLSVM